MACLRSSFRASCDASKQQCSTIIVNDLVNIVRPFAC
jgi:hypothetical protein